MERLYKISYVLEVYLIIIAATSYLSIYKLGPANGSAITFLIFLGPLIIVLFPAMVVGHILILGERFDLIFDKKNTSKFKFYMLDIFCVFGSISIVYLVLWFEFLTRQ
jgi:hypothetical protein